MKDSLENVLFVLDMINMLAVNDLGFFHRLNGILVFLSLHPANFDVTKGAYKNTNNQLEINLETLSLTFSEGVAKTDVLGLQFIENALVFRHG